MAKKAAAAPKSITKTEFLNALADANDMTRKQVDEFLQSMGQLIADNLGKKGPGVISVPGLMKISLKRKPAVPAREGINPFTKEKQMFKAKPASNAVKILPLKGLKDMV